MVHSNRNGVETSLTIFRTTGMDFLPGKLSEREGNDPKRRIVGENGLASDVLMADRARYVGSSHHTLKPSDYQFHPPTSPRPGESLRDRGRSVKTAEAKALFREGIKRRMVSSLGEDELPKYVWAVDSDGRAYEAILESKGSGYELTGGHAMRRRVIKEWQARCPAN